MELIEGVAAVDDLDAFAARLGEIGDEHGVTVQAFDARYVVDRAHLARAVELADRALARGENVARDRAVEILLYAAGTRQIDRALELGVDEGECPAVVLVETDGESEDPVAAEGRAAAAVRDLDGPGRIEPGATLGEYDPDRVREYFEVSDAELAAVEGTLADAVRERVALLDVEK
ncbi:KEOPS complex subunit Cgi121 [Halosimplex marinum]|uniref:KEOPS complex subunit Cgi121 n=1 Tax=Halosimplex marinum TaxID=3396620 RepID=UPI003F56494B